MIARLIRWSIEHRIAVLLVSAVLAAHGLWSLQRTPVDALPDLSDVQVILRTSWPGQSPQRIEDQVTYPIATTMLSVPGARTVRAYSFFGDSFVYVLFADGTDLYWARSRVLEYLNQVQSRLPAGASTALGPDATGVGWVYQYALVDRGGTHDLSELRALQDWYLKYELKAVPGVSEVATLGGMVRGFQVTLDPQRLRAHGLTVGRVAEAVRRANSAAGGSVLEQGEGDAMVRSDSTLRSAADFAGLRVSDGAGGVPVWLSDVARIERVPEMRRGLAELDGQGEVVGGVVVMRSGENARAVIAAVKAKLEIARAGLPRGVELVETYDRSRLIDRAVGTLWRTLAEEFAVVAAVCALFLLHLRSAGVALITLPLGIAIAFSIMHRQGINANIMSLGGIAIAIGAMVDAAIVMIENAHRHLSEHGESGAERPAAGSPAHWEVIARAAVEVGPALAASLAIITLSFLPVFALEAQEGRLFGPLAYTKTWTMAAATGLSVTLVPVLMGYWIRGRIPDERRNPVSRVLVAGYRPMLEFALRRPGPVLLGALLLVASASWPLSRLGGEFMPPLDEGDLLYMPTALPGLSAGKAAQLLQQTDRMILSVPEVSQVFGKAGRAESATDPAPIEMFETTVRFKPRSEWRAGMTPERLVAELDRAVKLPGLSNVWVPPIRNRIDMLATGIKSAIGIKVLGPDLAGIARAQDDLERIARTVPGVGSAVAERLVGGRYVDIAVDRAQAARYGMDVVDVQDVVGLAIGGERLGEVLDGRRRYPISLRYPRELRDSVPALRALPLVSPSGVELRLGDVTRIEQQEGPPMIRSENARLVGYVYVDVHGRDLASTVRALQQAVSASVRLPPGVTLAWSGQFEFLERAAARLELLVPITLAIIAGLLYLTFRRLDETLLILLSVPLALVGGLWLLHALGHAVSVASVVGFIALGGVAAEFGVVMLIYLTHAWERRLAAGEPANRDTLFAAIREGAVQRVRPKAMTVAVILAGLAPIMLGQGTGSEVMQRIAAPMLGGMITAPLLSMLVVPAAFLLLRRRELTG